MEEKKCREVCERKNHKNDDSFCSEKPHSVHNKLKVDCDDFSMDGNRIVKLKAGVAPHDAVNKK